MHHFFEFVNGSRYWSYHEKLLDLAIKKGHKIGNHTANHLDPNAVSLEELESNIKMGEAPIKWWLTSPKYFRFPYLHTGKTPKFQRAIFKYLREQGYTVVPVSVDTLIDWHYNRQYEESDSAEKRSQILDKYVLELIGHIKHFERLAKTQFGRPIKQILALHLNALNAAALTDLLNQLAANGHTFISVSEALADPVYHCENHQINVTEPSWLFKQLGCH